jgi:DNA-binding NarL/FixJ family response regulator
VLPFHQYEATVVSISVLIADDNTLIRNGLCNLFGGEEDFDVCGQASNGREAIEKAQELQPDVIVLDLAMPVMNGLDAARLIKRIMPRVPVVMFSAYSDTFTENEARSAGISALVSKLDSASMLVEKCRSVIRPLAS